MATTRIAVIMAGGTGERFWPVSRRHMPKQLLNLTTPDRSLLADALARLTPLFPPQRILVITGQHLVEPIRAAGLDIPSGNIIGEPCKRNTSGCLAYAAAVALARVNPEPDGVTMAVVTADHSIGDPPRFRSALSAALDASETLDALDRTLQKDDRGNIAVGNPVSIDSSGCIVYNHAGDTHMAVAVVGMENVVVVTTEDGVCVMPKSRAQDVREAVAELRRHDATQL